MKFSIEFDPTLSSSAKRALKWIALPAAVFLGVSAVAHAALAPPPADWIGTGKTVSAASLSGNLTQLDTRLTAVENLQKYRFQGFAQQSSSGVPTGNDNTFSDYSTAVPSALPGGTLIEVGAGPTPATMLVDGVTLRVPRAGVYKITFAVNLSSPQNALSVSLRLSDGSEDVNNPVHNTPVIPVSSPASYTAQILTYDFTLPTSATTVRFQYARGGSALQLAGDTVITVEEL